MTRAVLLPLDRSEKDARAIRAAEGFAKLISANIHIVHVVDGVLSGASNDPSGVRAAHHDDARNWIASRSRIVRAPADRAVSSGLVVSRSPAEAIFAIAKEQRAEMIVMATRAAGAMGRALYGSVADRVVRESNRPVVLVPPAVTANRGAHGPFRRILLPLDSSRDALRVLDKVLSLDRDGGLHFVLFQVVKPESTGGYIMPPGLPTASVHEGLVGEHRTIHVQLDQATTQLNAIADHIRLHHCEAEVLVVEADHPDYAIVRAAVTESVDFIAMTTSAFRGLSRWLMGSVADGVTRRSSVPVLLVAQ